MSFRCTEKTKLALHIIEQHFGSITKEVAHYLVNNEVSSLADITKHFKEEVMSIQKLKSSLIREVLLVLHQHNCLIISIPPEVENDLSNISQAEKLRQQGLLYSINLDMVINRLRFPSLLKIVQRLFGVVGVLVMEELILHGRRRVGQIKTEALPKTKTLIDNQNEDILKILSSEEREDDKLIEDKIQRTFESLVQRRLIVTVPSLDLQKKQYNTDSDFNANNTDSRKRKLGVSTSSSLPNGTNSSSSANNPTTSQHKRKKRESPAAQDIPTQDLPVELRLMMSMQAAASAVAASSGAVRNPLTNTTAPSAIQPAGATAVTAASEGGRGGGRGRGRGRGRGSSSSSSVVSAAAMEPLLTGGPSSLSSSSNPAVNTAGSINPVNGQSYGEVDFGPREDVLWTVGWEQYVREERHSRCAALAFQRMEAVAGSVVTTVLEVSLPTEMGGIQTHSAPVSFTTIYEKLNMKSIDMPTLRKLLELMRCDAAGMITKVPNSEDVQGGPLYMVNMAAILQLLKKRTIHSIVCEKFGLESGRIIELLLKKKYLEQQKIADLAILPAREARERIYKLHRNKWIDYFEVSKKNDFQSGSTSYFWFVDMTKMQHYLLEYMYKSIFNLSKRRIHEYEQGKDLVDFANQITDSSEADKFDKLALTLDRLDKAVMKVDETILMLDKL